MDNGAAENLEFGHKHLHTIAAEIGAHEIVVPDELGDYNGTVAKALAFSRFADPKYRYMAVAQGSNIGEVATCIRQYVQNPVLSYITVIGIPRLLVNFSKMMRVQIGEIIQAQGWDTVVEYHALGASSWLQEPMLLADMGVYRGIDTSFPIYQGLRQKDLRRYNHRPNDFFDMSNDTPMIRKNIDTFLEQCKYDPDAELPERP